MTPIRIAFENLAYRGWTAGGQYLKNLFVALKSLPEPPEIFLMVEAGTPAESYGLLQAYMDGEISIPASKWMRMMKSAYLRVPFPAALERMLLPRRSLAARPGQAGIQAVFSNDEYGPFFPLPLVTWIPDFQHIALPALFSQSKIQTRNAHNRRIARFATRVMLSSHTALNDWLGLNPQAAAKTRVVPFVAQLPPDVYARSPAQAASEYHLPERFFYLPNQFWKHKNHKLVIEALKLLKDDLPDLVVACTGNTYEFRGAGYYGELVDQVKADGLERQMRFLGVVEHDDLLQLMRQSLAVLQPSMFEGWSTTVEEAKSLGKGMLLSALAVHREQNPPDSVYFDPQDAAGLAACLAEAYRRRSPGPDMDLEARARQSLPERTQKFGQAFMQIMLEII